jgi:hypothetical protein
LAAACAECGDFAEAVRSIKRALEPPDLDREPLTSFRDQLKLYEQHKPYREK